jgi:hypothetical protein
MKNYLKDKRVLVGILIVGALGYYFYDQNRKAMIKARAEALASTPATTTTPEVTTAPKPTPIVSPKREISSSLVNMQKEVI